MPHVLVLNTCPDLATAETLARYLVAERLAACVNIVPAVQSVYEWQGKTELATECLLYIKTRRDRYTALEQALRERHPYELPEIIAVPIEAGLPAYLQWVDHQTEQQQ